VFKTGNFLVVEYMVENRRLSRWLFKILTVKFTVMYYYKLGGSFSERKSIFFTQGGSGFIRFYRITFTFSYVEIYSIYAPITAIATYYLAKLSPMDPINKTC